MSEALISQESARIVQEVTSFLESTIVDITISNEIEKKNAVTLGNELQKKWRTIENTRTQEKGIWDAKSKAVQAEFKPVLDKIAEKKNTLGIAITAYDRKLEIERQKRQKELEDAAQKERERLEAFAGKREERLQVYIEKLDEAKRELAQIRNDATAVNVLMREIRYFESKVQEFTEKVSETVQAAAQVVTPIYRPEIPTASAGTRVTMEAKVQITDMKQFAAWCIEHDECQFLLHNETKMKDRVKEKEGHLEIPGVVCSWTAKTGFSGR